MTTEIETQVNTEATEAKKPRNDATLSSIDRKLARMNARIAKWETARARLLKLREFIAGELQAVREEMSA